MVVKARASHDAGVVRMLLNKKIRFITFSGESGSGKNLRMEILKAEYPRMTVIRSFTTRPLRPEGDSEYTPMEPREFKKLENDEKFMWVQQAHGHFYGTMQSEVDDAIIGRMPSLMHVHRSKVKILQDDVTSRLMVQGVLSFYVLCGNREVLKRRILERDPNITDQELGRRLNNIAHNNERALSSGDYHYVLESCDSKTHDQILQEMTPHISTLIPRPRRFYV